MHMKKIRTFILITLTAFPAGMAAQTQPQDSTLNRTVVVEQEYAPNIRDAAKINAVPAVEAPVVQPKAVEYDNRLQPAGDIPAENMQAYAGRQKLSKATPGYLRLGYGNYGNLDIRANYLFCLSPKDRLNLTFGMDGMNGTLHIPGSTSEWDSYYYRTHAAIDYRHAFSQVDMDLAGHFDLSNFNLLPGAADRKRHVLGDAGLSFEGSSRRRCRKIIIYFINEKSITSDNTSRALPMHRKYWYTPQPMLPDKSLPRRPSEWPPGWIIYSIRTMHTPTIPR